ncbi:hypothetical protein ACOJM8_000955 [Klebsiella aerogenes]
MSKFKREKLNPITVIENHLGIKCEHITHDPSMRPSDAHYQIVRQCSHDGTSAFTWELLTETVINLARMKSFSKKFPPDESKKLVGIKYTVGMIWLSTVYGRVELPAGECPGQRERTRISVTCEYLYSEDFNGELNG